MLPGLSLNSSRIHEFVTSVLQQCGGTFVFKGPWFGSLDSLLTSNLANVHHILRKKVFNYHKGIEFKEIFAEIFGDGIFCSDGDRWKTQRRTIHSFIKHSKFEEAHFSEQRREVDMKEVLKRFLFDFVCLLMLGFDPNSLSIEFPRVPYKQAYYDMEEVIFQRHLKPQWFGKLQKWLQIGEERKMKISSEIFDRLLYQCIWRKKELLNRRKTPIDRDDFNFLTFMLFEDNNQEEREMSAFKKSEKYARDMAFNLLSAGSETVSSAICESLWLYPPLPFEHTVSVGSDTLPSGHQIGKYTRAIYSPYSMGRMEEIWGGDCLEFKPERWISNKGELGDVSPYKFTAFNAGPRAYYDMELGEFSQRTQMHPSC
ncbi:hypothetical protein OIU76_022286 [Salix suchowensis]|nr:hypothetical protein OIU76_022286 [Salix suchowensis]